MIKVSAASNFAPTLFMSEASTPEHRLWYAVIIQVIVDCEQALSLSHKISELVGVAPIVLRGEYDRVISQISHPWFSVACSFVDVHPRLVYREIENVKRKFNFDHLQFVTDDVYLKKAYALISKEPDHAMALLAPVSKYGHYCNLMRIKQLSRGRGRRKKVEPLAQ